MNTAEYLSSIYILKEQNIIYPIPYGDITT